MAIFSLSGPISVRSAFDQHAVLPARSEHELLDAIEITQTWKHGNTFRSATGVSMPSPPSGVVSFLFTDVE
jgi:hypothetical protein